MRVTLCTFLPQWGTGPLAPSVSPQQNTFHKVIALFFHLLNLFSIDKDSLTKLEPTPLSLLYDSAATLPALSSFSKNPAGQFSLNLPPFISYHPVLASTRILLSCSSKNSLTLMFPRSNSHLLTQPCSLTINLLCPSCIWR